MPNCTQCGVALELETATGRCAGCETTLDGTPGEAPPGVVIPGYELLEPLGRGGMGEVVRARQRSLDRQVAIKLIHPHKVNDPSLVARFGREARLLARLNHAHIVAIYDFGESAGRLFLVMELVDGRTLRQVLETGPMTPRLALDSMRQICDAVGYAHELGIVHRDLKPENVLIDSAGTVKIADFGLARLLQPESGQSGLTQEGAILGTLRYMAPEQLAGVADIDARADVFALGSVLYELLTGSLPQGSFRPPSQRAAIDPRLDTVVLKALAPDRRDRFANARELQQAITAATSPTGSEQPAIRGGGENQTVEWQRPFIGSAPQPPTRLIGRDGDMEELMRLCRSHRLVTLLGPGGTGKTRLAIEFVRQASDDWPDGAWFVELAEISTDDLVAPAIAHALQLKEAGDAVESLLTAYLRERRILLVLDNCEQVPGAAPLVSRLLETSPGLRIVATSRIPLHVRAEHEYHLAPLPVPSGGALESAEAAPAVQLFVERAQAVRADFRLTSANSPAVAEICRRLDGLPLALELAAARLRLFSPDDLLARLDQSLKVLTGGARDLPARQRTLRAAIAWSYDLLSAGDRALFRWLSVFSGRFQLEAAEEVCRSLSEQHEGFEILDGMTALVEQSLLRAIPDAGRFEMLVTLREYAAERLAAEGEEPGARAAFATWGANLLEAAAPHLDTAASGVWVKRLTDDWDNVRSVLQYLARQNPAAALQLAGNTWYAGYQNGRLAETRERLVTLLALPGNEAPTAARATAAHGAGTLSWVTGNVIGAGQLFDEALSIRRGLGDSVRIAATLNNMGILAREQSQYDVAEAHHAEALALRRSAGDPGPVATSLANLGLVASDRGEVARAQELMDEALQLYRQLGDDGKTATVLGNLGRLAMMQGHVDEAVRYASEALAIHESLGSARGMILSRLAIAAADSVAGNLESAEVAARTSLDSAVDLEDAWLQSYSYASLAFVAEKRCDWSVALDCYRESLRRRVELGDVSGQGEMFERVAVVLHAMDQDVPAMRLLGAEEALQQQIGYVRFPLISSATQAVRDSLRARHGDEAFEREWAAGAAMPRDEVVRLALSIDVGREKTAKYIRA